jgi:hypothetical protein
LKVPDLFTNVNGKPDISSDTLIRKWKPSYFLLTFAGFWNIFLAFAFLHIWNGPLTLNGKNYSSIQAASEADPTMFFFLSYPVVGLIVAYIAAALIFNRTTISLKDGHISVSRGPMPWYPKRLIVSTSSIRQVYVEEYTSHSENKRPVIVFRVMAQISIGEDVCIDKGFPNYSSAKILEQWLESKLGIEDEIVPGEVG